MYHSSVWMLDVTATVARWLLRGKSEGTACFVRGPSPKPPMEHPWSHTERDSITEALIPPSLP